MKDPGANALIVGCGDIGRRVAQRYSAAGRQVTAWVRSEASGKALAASVDSVLVCDLDQPSSSAEIAAQPLRESLAKCADSHVFYFAPPPRQGRSDPRVTAFLSMLDECAVLPGVLVYISTSAVYGDCQGRWIDEDAPLNPGTERGFRRVDAESQLQAFGQQTACRTVILRVPGIYGPGRLPLQRLRDGLPILSHDDAPYTNRIHSDDLADAALLAAGAPASAIYNVSDGSPTTMTDYFFRIADRFGLPRPPVVSRAEAEQQLSESMLSFLRESKRLRVERIASDLGFSAAYPDLDSGLAAIDRETAPVPD